MDEAETVSHETPKAKNRIEQDIGDLVGVFTDPIIVWPSPWQDTLPDWIKPAITIERLVEQMKALKGERPTATDAEVMAYMYPRTMEAALDRDWTQIYLYISTRVISRHRETEIPEDIKVESLDNYQMQRLKELKDWIYRKRTEARLEKDRAERRERREEEAERKKKEQLTLFPI